jgi:HTH-type transcriptional regulator, competence development regulator
MSRGILSKQVHKTFGETLRKLREDRDMPLRELASILEIDQSTLSKIERNERKAGKELIEKIANVFNMKESELRINFMSDIIAYELLHEEHSIDILKVAEEKLEYLKTKRKKSK